MTESDDLITMEEYEELKETISNHSISTAAEKIKEFLEQQNRVELDIAVTGESGSGKSKFVNAFRGLGDEDEDSAKTGVVETTMKPEVYLHPKYKNVKVWDLPGIGTPNFKANEYLQQVQFERYDFFIIIASDRFRECHTQLAKEIMRMGKTFYFVRSKIDVAIYGEKKKKTFDQAKILENIRENCYKELRKIGVQDPVVFLISGCDLGKYDFNLLHERIEKELPQHKRHVLLLAVPNITLEINEKKKKALKKNIIRIALLSAGTALAPIPGLSIVADLNLVKSEIDKYRWIFGLDSESLKRFCEQFGHSTETVNNLIESVWVKGCLGGAIIGLLCATPLLIAGSASACIPVMGSVVAGGLSFTTVFLLLKKALNDIAEDARKLLHLSLQSD